MDKKSQYAHGFNAGNKLSVGKTIRRAVRPYRVLAVAILLPGLGQARNGSAGRYAGGLFVYAVSVLDPIAGRATAGMSTVASTTRLPMPTSHRRPRCLPQTAEAAPHLRPAAGGALRLPRTCPARDGTARTELQESPCQYRYPLAPPASQFATGGFFWRRPGTARIDRPNRLFDRTKFSFHRGIDKLRPEDHGSTPRNGISAPKLVPAAETMRRARLGRAAAPGCGCRRGGLWPRGEEADLVGRATQNLRRLVNQGEDGS